MKQDLIDFPCSPTWASYYAETEQTDDYPREFYERPRPARNDEQQRRYMVALEEIRSLRRELAQASREIVTLRRRLTGQGTEAPRPAGQLKGVDV